MYAHELYEQNKPRVVVTYPGRFQPFHQGHAGVFAQLQKKFGRDSVYILTSNDTNSAKSPFNFSDKYQLMAAAGVPGDKIIETNQMYKLPDSIDAANTIFITAVGAPDADRLNPDTYTKRDQKDKEGNITKPAGSPSYYKIWNDKEQPVTADQHGYVIVIPEIHKEITIKGRKYDVSHGTECRNLWNTFRNDPKARKEFLSQMYTRPSQELAVIFDKIPQATAEDISADSQYSTSPIHGVDLKQGVAEGLSEAREGAMREIIRKELPSWPDYVIKDWISSRIKNEEDLKNLQGWLGELNKMVRPNSWQLHQKMFLTFDMLNPRSRYFMKTKRKFGDRNPFLIPRDKERLEDAIKLVQAKGIENLPPISMLQHDNGLELCEGWHRTMAAFRLHPEGFYINAWIGQAGQQGVAEGNNQSSAKTGIYQSEVYGTRAYHSKCLEKGCDWESRRYDRIKQAQDAAKKHAQTHIKSGMAEGLDEAVGGNYLYHATGADGLKGMLSSGGIRSADGPQKATQAQTALPTVSVTRDWGYASGSNATQQSFGGIGRHAVIVLDRNAVESNFKTLSTSQSRDIRGMPRASEPGLSGALTVRKRMVKPGVELKGQHKMSYGTAKAGGEFEEAVVVPKGALPLKGTMVGFWVNPKSELMNDPAIMNHPMRLEMPRPNTFVKAGDNTAPATRAPVSLDQRKLNRKAGQELAKQKAIARKQGVAEDAAGVGVVAKNKKMARDPRYSMSITKDVKPSTPKNMLRAFRLSEDSAVSEEQIISMVKSFLPLAMKELKLRKLPKIVIKKHIETHDGQATFGRFANEEERIYLGIADRHPVDILRTLAHELVHFKQHEQGRMEPDSGDTGSPIENEANAVAGVLMRYFNKKYPNAVKSSAVSLDESLFQRYQQFKENGDEADEIKKQKNLIPFPKGTVKVDVSDVYDWYKIGQEISDLDDADPADFGKGPPQTVMAFGSESEEHRYLKDLKRLGLKTHDIDENFADGRNPQDKGDSKRYNVPTKGKISTLRKIAKQGGRRGQLAHWAANMRSGKNKK